MSTVEAGIVPIALACLVPVCGLAASALETSVAQVEDATNRITQGGATMTTNRFSVSQKNQKELLSIARQSMEHYLKEGRHKTFETTDPELLARGAVFVTLTQRGQLRGCIGTLEPRSSLIKAVADFAVEAAVNDGRFPPLTLKELPVTHIEISVLSPMERVKSADDIQQNIHGVVVKRGGRGGLFLPQVWEHFSTKEGFLDELCRQIADLPADGWKDPTTELLVFTVFPFE
ncbi:MAG: AmmeMemoRadiSam system protein A, partial [bacterium]